GGGAASNGAAQGQGPKANSNNRQPRSNAGGTPGTPGKNRRQGGQGGQGRNGGGRGRPADGRITSLDRDELPRAEAAVRNPREKQPIIVHKGSRLDRFPSAEQLDELSNSTRPRGEKPALLTR
ncbi:hypothetical protein ACW4UO_28780, partial [Klebsiella pneumoniae]